MRLKTSFRITGLMLLLMIHVTINWATARTYDQIIAYVNDEVITQRELDEIVNQRALELQQVYRFSEREAREKAKGERPELLDRVIRQMLLVETALTLKIEVTTAELEQYVQDFKDKSKIKTDEEFVKQLKKEGFTPAAFREQAKRNLMAERLVMQRILPKLQVRDADVMRFFEENRAQFTTKTDEVHLRHIFIAFKPTEADRQMALQRIDSILQEAKSGVDFEELARRYSQNNNPQSQVGTLIELPNADVGKLSDTFRTALSALNTGEISEPIDGVDGLYLFKVERKDDQTIAFRYLVSPLKPGEDAIQDTYNRANEILQKLDRGEDFSLLAQRYSDDTETKANGGALGTRSLNELNPETRKIIEGLSVGQHTPPVKTTYGLHIFTIESRTTPELTEAEKEQIRVLLREQKFQEEWQTYTDLLREQAFIKIKPLES
ncbi:peptidylprolyl isomerase [Candidatus Poribacteria bacterium]|nr:peptidylprolyl isomerase [Candidatus Poribacteria bacterium]